MQAFPVAQLMAPDLSLEGWQDFALARLREAEEGQGGIFAAEDGRGYVLGLACYFVEVGIGRGRVLSVDQIVALGLLESQRREAFEKLLAAVQQRAREAGCTTVHVHVPLSDGAERPLDLLGANAYRREASVYCKPVQAVC